MEYCPHEKTNKQREMSCWTLYKSQSIYWNLGNGNNGLEWLEEVGLGVKTVAQYPRDLGWCVEEIEVIFKHCVRLTFYHWKLKGMVTWTVCHPCHILWSLTVAISYLFWSHNLVIAHVPARGSTEGSTSFSVIRYICEEMSREGS